MTRKIALLGYGAIARTIETALRARCDIEISHVLVRSARMAELRDRLPPSVAIISEAQELGQNMDFVLECASHDAVRAHAADILSCGHDLGLLSVGALADDATRADLEAAAQRGNARLSILPGAIGGIDALAAAGPALQKVTYSAGKPPGSWTGSPAEATHDLAAITEPTVIFSGTAREAALVFPKNANVVATVALAAIGFDETQVSLVADPGARGNTHRIVASGNGYEMEFSTKSVALPDNPRTSTLTAQSALRALRHLTPGLKV